MTTWDSDPINGHDVSQSLMTAWEQFRNMQGQVHNDGLFEVLPLELRARAKIDLKHEMLGLALQGHYIAPELVRPILARRDGPRPAILDVGTGTGIWATCMAREFPHAEVVGVDLVMPKPLDSESRAVPPNCRFETDDVNQPLDHYQNSFDVIHARLVDAGIMDFDKFLDQVARMLRPGGIVLLVKGVHNVYSETVQSLPVNEGEPGFSYLQRIFITVYNAIKLRGGEEDAASEYEQMLAQNPNFKDSVVKDLFIPIGPWGAKTMAMDERSIHICELMRINCVVQVRAVKPLLLDKNYPESEVDRWIAEAERELRTLSIKTYTRWRYAYAMRCDGPWIPPKQPAMDHEQTGG